MGLFEKRRLGRSRLRVSSIGIGTAALAMAYGPPEAAQPAPSRGEAVAALRLAFDSGVTLVDTAPAYEGAEAFVGEAIRGRDETLVATKVTLRDGGSGVRASVERSLKLLGRDRIDLLQVHNASTEVVRDRAVLRELSALRAEGLVGALGATTYDEDSALAVIGSDTFESVQLPYNGLDRRAERRILPEADKSGCGVLARSVLMRGLLSPAAQSLPRGWEPMRQAIDDFRRALGAEWDELPAAALAFVASAPGVACAITGPRDGAEFSRLIDGAHRFAERGAHVRSTEPPDIDPRFLDPRVWPSLGSAFTL